MTRLTEIAGAGSTAERWDLRSLDLASIAQTAETLRAQFIAGQIRRAARAFGRWSGLAALPGSLRRRLQHRRTRSEEHTTELQSIMRLSYALFCLNKKTQTP